MECRFSYIFWSVVSVGIAWNVFGVIQFLSSLRATGDSLAAQGLTPTQIEVMLGYPSWMTVAFAIGVFGGLIGSVALALKKNVSVMVFLVSLIAYIALYIGDITEGVFAAMGTPQIVVLTTVVAIAFGLWWFARYCQNQGKLN